MEIPKQYDSRQSEQDHYARWEAEGCFTPEANRDPEAPVFSIAIPPPNVTGNLHLGHALQHTLMDILARHKRMSGYKTLWLPGTDHAGISTQLMVTRQLKGEGLTPQDLGREKFVERVWQWKREYGFVITNQMRREGASVDWSRERFTMDAGLSRAVREVFVRLYEAGFIYRGDRIVNWDTVAQTVLSDLEVEKKTQKGKLTYLRYPVTGSDGREFIVVATTRPETMLGDTAVAVHADDERYKNLVGKTIDLPLTDRRIPIIADEYVDPAFGTGAVKITPAHDPNDYEIGERHNLPHVVIMNKHARMTEATGADFAGLDRFEAREKVIRRFDELGLLEKNEDYEFAISLSERSKVPIEPLVMTQWFCRMDAMRDKALGLMREEGLPRFTPENPYKKVYTEWLENLRDWTISRQLWWGHQIPAWFVSDGRFVVGRDEPEARQKLAALYFEEALREENLLGDLISASLGSEDLQKFTAAILKQDAEDNPKFEALKKAATERAETAELTQESDVLDTWFSSALWSFSTLGFPDDTEDLQAFHPTSVLVTARDIVFLWVSRMVMTSLEFLDEPPFHDVFITGTVLDKNGQRMSKTKGNGVDPLDVFDKYGVDATRLVLANAGATDTRWSDTQVESYRNFANKIWNAARFCLMNSEGASIGYDFVGHKNELTLHDRWCVSRLNKVAGQVNDALSRYQFHEAVYALYHFFWDDFCDWYIELSKQDVSAPEDSPERREAVSRALSILEAALRLLHPFMPYITEDLWRRLPGTLAAGSSVLHPAYRESKPTIMLTAFPVADERLIDEAAEGEMNTVIELISRVRTIRAELNIKPSEQLTVIIGAHDENLRRVISTNEASIKRLARASELKVDERLDAPRASARAVLGGGGEVAVPLEGLIDFDKERARLSREMDRLNLEAERGAAQLTNPNFAGRAPQEKVDELKAKVADTEGRIAKLKIMVEALG